VCVTEQTCRGNGLNLESNRVAHRRNAHRVENTRPDESKPDDSLSNDADSRVAQTAVAKNKKVNSMLYTIAVVLVVLWLLGLVTSYTLGGFIHILLVIAVIMILVNLISGRRGL
jgi:hypothetical protein